MQISLLIQTRTLFHWRKRYYGLWTRILVINVLMLDLFHLLSSQDVNWWTGVVWIIVVFLSAVWTLILTAPIHCRASIAETLMQWHISTNLMKKQTHLHLGLEYIFSKFYFWVTISFHSWVTIKENNTSINAVWSASITVWAAICVFTLIACTFF